MIGLKLIWIVFNIATTEDASLQKTRLFAYVMMAIPETTVATVSQLVTITKYDKNKCAFQFNVKKIH